MPTSKHFKLYSGHYAIPPLPASEIPLESKVSYRIIYTTMPSPQLTELAVTYKEHIVYVQIFPVLSEMPLPGELA